VNVGDINATIRASGSLPPEKERTCSFEAEAESLLSLQEGSADEEIDSN
jgi:hypothetical protein